MPQIRCPHCRAMLDVEAEPEGRTIVCAHCEQVLHLPPTGQIQLPEMRLDALPAVNAIKEPATDLPAVRRVRPREPEFSTDAPAFRSEMARFTGLALPNLESLGVEKLPPEVQAQASMLGLPIASLHLPGSEHTQRKRLIAGLIVCTVGLALLLGSLMVGIRRWGQEDHVGMLPVYAVTCLLVGIPLLLGKRTPAQTYWICPEGMIWQWGQGTGHCRWHEIARLSSAVVGGRAVYWFSPARGINIVLRRSLDPDAVLFAEYVELKASAALLPVALDQLQHGECVEFGQLRLDDAGVYCRQATVLRSTHVSCPWDELVGVYVDAGQVRVDRHGHRGFMKLRALDVSFPMVVQAIARIVAEQGLPAAD
jgi:hypothetical protein